MLEIELREMDLMNLLVMIISLLIIPRGGALGCYNSIFSFGDSTSDTGNFFLTNPPGTSRTKWSFLLPPYGETFFHYPTGRCSNGRLILDFTAEFVGLPLLPPYLEIKNNLSVQSTERGVNFAVVGATVLDTAFLEALGTPTIMTNCTLAVQMDWFKDMLSSLCNTSSECRKQILSSSLIMMGGIGANDYNHALLGEVSIEKLQPIVPLVIDGIASTIHELIELGASSIMIAGNLPNGCLPCYLTIYETSNQSQYNSSTGCLNWMNNFAEDHNEQLQIALNRIRSLHPHVTLIYADYYNSLLQLIESPEQFGFIGATRFIACCGGGGRYNYNTSLSCGTQEAGMVVCENPAEFISWDGIHPTEAAYWRMTKALLQGNYTSPPISSTLCVSDV